MSASKPSERAETGPLSSAGTSSRRRSAADALKLGGGNGGFIHWRVPSIRELASIVEYNGEEPAIRLFVFPDTPAAAFWNSNTWNDTRTALTLRFEKGRTAHHSRIFGLRVLRSPGSGRPLTGTQ